MNAVTTEDILGQLEAGPLDSFAIAKILDHSHVAVLSKLEDLIDARQVSIDSYRTNGLPEYRLFKRPRRSAKPASIASGPYVPEVTPLKGYESSLMAFCDACMLTRR
ncbi:hypothetical protein [Pandoraea soli]